MNHDEPEVHVRMATSLADFLELLSSTRRRALASGQRPTEIPDDLKAALLRLISD